jgi:hypothetical protein
VFPKPENIPDTNTGSIIKSRALVVEGSTQAKAYDIASGSYARDLIKT